MKNLELAETWLECMGVLMERDGYVVLGTHEPFRTGQTVKDRFRVGSDFLVMGLATHEDALRQKKVLEEVAGASLPSPEWPDYFYKTVLVAN